MSLEKLGDLGNLGRRYRRKINKVDRIDRGASLDRVDEAMGCTRCTAHC